VKVTPTSLPEVLVLERVSSRRSRYFFELECKEHSRKPRPLGQFRAGQRVLLAAGSHVELLSSQAPQESLPAVMENRPRRCRRSTPVVAALDTGSVELHAENRQLWMPQDSGTPSGQERRAVFLYKTTDYWFAEYDRSLRWNDPKVGIELSGEPVLATKDGGARCADARSRLSGFSSREERATWLGLRRSLAPPGSGRTRSAWLWLESGDRWSAQIRFCGDLSRPADLNTWSGW
jgi:dTDP-4-dehydrorhamnose 3,5-epimerase